ncbi:hypothetical protein YC2023_018120 [Brassica napus]
MSSDISYVFNLRALETWWSKSATSIEKYTDIDGKVNVDAKNVNVERGTETDCSLKVSQACNERAARRYWWRTSALSRSVSEEEEVKEKEECKRGSWSHLDCERSRVVKYSRICKHRIILSGWYIPVGSVLCFVAKLRGRELWIGILLGCFFQTVVLALVTFFTNWEQEATKARNRVLEMSPKGNQETEIIKEDVQVLLSDISENVATFCHSEPMFLELTIHKRLNSELESGTMKYY